MKAIILAAGSGRRLGTETPKCLLTLGGKSLLQRHLELLLGCGVAEVAIGLGYRAAAVAAALAPWRRRLVVHTVHNPRFAEGSVVTLWTLGGHLDGEVLLMDADVLYDRRLLARLLESPHRDCFLLDRNLEPGEEPVKLCLRHGRPAEFGKRVEGDFELCGESVGFFKLSAAGARDLRTAAGGYVSAGRGGEPHEEALRELLLADPDRFGYEDITGLPWIEIDFPEDLARAEAEVLPRLEDGP